MKTLFVVRHAKSSWDDLSLSDHERPVSITGVRKTEKIIGYLNERNILPDLLKSSSAVRALETAKMIALGIGYPVNRIELSENLYHANSDTVFDELYVLPDEINSVMIFGHNPTLTYFVDEFLQPAIDNLPTTGVVSISFETKEWEKINMVDFKINFVVTPKMLK